MPTPAVASSTRALRVLLADDHEVVRKGTRQVLESAGDIEVVGEAGDGAQAIAMVADLRPDVAVIDLKLPDYKGTDVITLLAERYPDVKFMVLSAFDDAQYVQEALRSGARGYLLKTIAGEDLISAVRQVSQGNTILDPVVSQHLAGSSSARAGPNSNGNGKGNGNGNGNGVDLTERERQIIALIAQGLPNKEVATRLRISARTVEGHLYHVYAKLGLSSRTELVRYALTNLGSPESLSVL